MSTMEMSLAESQNQQEEQQAFDDGIHRLVNAIRRPSKNDENNSLAVLQSLLEHLINLCGDNVERWKTFILAITHKRYHLLSPQAKQDSSQDAGDGERLVFYTAISTLFTHVQQEQQDSPSHASLALDCLVRIAPLAGGSRDACTILERMISTVVLEDTEMKQARATMVDVRDEESLSSIVGFGVCMLQEKLQQPRLSSIKFLLDLAADTLDKDICIVRNYNPDDKKKQKELPSTLHVFLPHRDRGRPSSNKRKKRGGNESTNKKPAVCSDRQVVNSIAEILIWSRTLQANNNTTFANCFESLVEAGATCRSGDGTKLKTNLHVMQTIIRSLRKELNNFARAQGFMLSDQYQLNDSDALTLAQVVRGKAGDLSNLTRLAKKKDDLTTIGLIMARHQLGKVDKFSCVNEIITSALDANEYAAQEFQELYVNRIKATMNHLRAVIKTCEKSVVVSSMENSKSNNVTAILVAAAMSQWDIDSDDVEMDETTEAVSNNASAITVKLFVGGNAKIMTCFQDFLTLLNEAALGLGKNAVADAPSFMDQDGIATNKAVTNMIERHLNDSETMLLITSGDIRLPSDFMKALTERGCTLHCHDTDVIGERLSREAARKGDITISLAWDTTDDLDLHVILPDGEHIYFSHKDSSRHPAMLDVDMNVSGQSKEPVENVFVGDLDKMVQAPPGKYQVIVQNYAYHERGASTTQAAIPFRVVIEQNGIKDKFHGQCKGTGERSNVLVHEFTYEGRTIPFPSEEKNVTAFATSNMVNLTASTGQTLESLVRLVTTVQELEHLDTVRMLVDDDDEEKEEGPMDERPSMAQPGTLEVTSRDRINMVLARLPQRFHVIIGEAFGGPSLVETCAMEISRRMVADNVPISELKRNGYPEDVVQAVKAEMGKTSRP